MNASYAVKVVECDGIWLATCPELGATGSGFTQEEAIKSVILSMKAELRSRAESLTPELVLSGNGC